MEGLKSKEIVIMANLQLWMILMITMSIQEVGMTQTSGALLTEKNIVPGFKDVAIRALMIDKQTTINN